MCLIDFTTLLGSEISGYGNPALRDLESAALEQKLVDLFTILKRVCTGTEGQFAETLCCLFSGVTEQILLQEFVVVVPSDEVNTTGAEDSEHDSWLLHAVE